MGNGGFWAIDITGYVQIAFWLIVAGLSILTYIQAKKSFFQPLRTEVFKLQIVLLTRVSDLFVSKSEMDLRDFFGFYETLRINTHLMAERYAKELGAEVPSGKGVLDLKRDILGGALLSVKSEDAFQLISAPSDEKTQYKTPRTETAWSDYEHDLVHVTKQFYAALSDIETLSREPLLPSGLRALLESLVTAAHENIKAIRSTLTEAAEKMPASYPTFESLKDANFHWVPNIWNRKSTDLEPIADEIVAFTRSYFAPEMIGYPRTARDKKAKVGSRFARRLDPAE